MRITIDLTPAEIVAICHVLRKRADQNEVSALESDNWNESNGYTRAATGLRDLANRIENAARQ